MQQNEDCINNHCCAPVQTEPLDEWVTRLLDLASCPLPSSAPGFPQSVGPTLVAVVWKASVLDIVVGSWPRCWDCWDLVCLSVKTKPLGLSPARATCSPHDMEVYCMKDFGSGESGSLLWGRQQCGFSLWTLRGHKWVSLWCFMWYVHVMQQNSTSTSQIVTLHFSHWQCAHS